MIGSNNLRRSRGFALIIAVVLSAVAAAITVAVTTLAYKSLLLSSAARESQYAFYAADTALECALFWDNGAPGHNTFAYTAGAPGARSITCGSATVTFNGSKYDGNTDQYLETGMTGWFMVNGNDCAKITVYKDSDNSTQIFANGANVSCSTLTTDPRAVERGLEASY